MFYFFRIISLLLFAFTSTSRCVFENKLGIKEITQNVSLTVLDSQSKQSVGDTITNIQHETPKLKTSPGQILRVSFECSKDVLEKKGQQTRYFLESQKALRKKPVTAYFEKTICTGEEDGYFYDIMIPDSLPADTGYAFVAQIKGSFMGGYRDIIKTGQFKVSGVESGDASYISEMLFPIPGNKYSLLKGNLAVRFKLGKALPEDRQMRVHFKRSPGVFAKQKLDLDTAPLNEMWKQKGYMEVQLQLKGIKPGKYKIRVFLLPKKSTGPFAGIKNFFKGSEEIFESKRIEFVNQEAENDVVEGEITGKSETIESKTNSKQITHQTTAEDVDPAFFGNKSSKDDNWY